MTALACGSPACGLLEFVTANWTALGGCGFGALYIIGNARDWLGRKVAR